MCSTRLPQDGDTPTKLLPLTSPNPNTNPNRTQTLTVINPTKP